jgi:hypothetical protein
MALGRSRFFEQPGRVAVLFANNRIGTSVMLDYEAFAVKKIAA